MQPAALVITQPDNLADRLDALADRLRTLAPCHRNPERFHEERSDIENELRGLIANLPRGWTQLSDQRGRLKRASFSCAPIFLR